MEMAMKIKTSSKKMSISISTTVVRLSYLPIMYVTAY
jgi:hypothetical protein